ncbi:MAG TPA: aminotransferase class V-fold PLP-dependent enzyme, partial [Syntrophales bacterium]|nr:aminotransferase class V-fold PLP-dependent enzyme [Syntrophales bacterium]HOL59309.1 aminotransferase class V-fold PLP-dependent enzyme [Syntrophales bacterium]HPO35498.1 aminotransferase class V-fold PLP-dependent enzyme [Syntrophales bacterium]
EKIRKKERILTERFLSGLEAFDEDVKIYGAREEKDKIALVSFNISGLSPSYVAQVLDENWAIMCRPGLHCAPSAHRTIGSFPVGTVRFSFGYFNTEEEIDLALEALKSLIKKRDKGA